MFFFNQLISNNQFMIIDQDDSLVGGSDKEMNADRSGHSKDLFFDISPDLFCIASAEGFFIEVNRAFQDTLGYSREELLKAPFLEFVHPDDREETLEEFSKDLQEHETRSFINRYRCSKGDYKWLEWRARISNDKQTVTAIARDISEGKLTRELLWERENILKAITTSAGDAIIMIDSQGSITFWNDAGTRIFGYSPGEVMNRNLHDLLAPKRFHEDHQKAFPRFVQTGDGAAIGKTLELSALRKDGTEFQIELTLSSVQIRNEWSAIGIIREITERLKANEELRKLSRAVDQSPVSIVITNQKGEIEFANPKACQLTGYTMEELLHQNPRVLKSGETPAADYADLWNTISAGRQWRGVFHNKKKNGELYWESASISPILDANGNITHYLAVKEDITERRKTEMQLTEQAEKMKELNATKDKFFGIIAHDLKSPFNAIIGISEVTVADVPELDPKDLLERLEMIRSSAKQAYHLLENLLIWARTQTKRLEFNPVVLDAEQLTTNTIALVKGQALKKKINLVNDDCKKCYVFADRNMIETVLRNLVTNALKFTPHGGTVRLMAVPVKNGVEFLVCDTGVGMSKESIEKLFRIETSFSTRGTENERGTGLGLILCQEFITRHGGNISVTSEKGKGSTFRFTLPSPGL
jgi:PAS domain S-box-containing protein